MEDVRSTARLADPAGFDFASRGLTTTIPRSEIEEALSYEEQPALFLDVSAPEADESYSVRVAWERADLEKLLEMWQTEEIPLTFDRDEIASAIGGEVEAHGLREKALIFTVVAATAAGATAAANAQIPRDDWGKSAAPAVVATTAADRATDASSSGPVVAATPTAADQLSDASSSGPAVAVGGTAADRLTDASSSGPVVAATPTAADQLSDASSSGAAVAVGGTAADRLTDASSSGPVSVAPGNTAADLLSDASSSGPMQPVTPAGDSGGISISAPSTGAITGAIALMITGAAFALGGKGRRQRPGTA